MSQHTSLRIDSTLTRHRNVLKRHERIRRLMELEKWGNRTSVFGLPKVKSLKIKMKKVKAEKAEAAPAAGVSAAPQAPAAEKKTPATTPPAAEKKKPAGGEKEKK